MVMRIPYLLLIALLIHARAVTIAMESQVSGNQEVNKPICELSITPERTAHFVLTQIIPNTPLQEIPNLFEKMQQQSPGVANALLRFWFESELPQALPKDVCWHVVKQFKHKKLETTSNTTIELEDGDKLERIRQDFSNKQKNHLDAFFKNKTTSYVCVPDVYSWDSSVSESDCLAHIRGITQFNGQAIRRGKLKANSITEQENLEECEVVPYTLQIFTTDARYTPKPMLVLQDVIRATPTYTLTNNFINFDKYIVMSPIAHMDSDTLYINQMLFCADKNFLLGNYTGQLKNIECTPAQNFGHHVAYAIKVANTVAYYEAGKIYLRYLPELSHTGITPSKLIELAGILSYNDNELMHKVLATHMQTKSKDIYLDKPSAERVMKLPYDVRALFKKFALKIHVGEQPKPQDPISILGIVS